VPASPLTSSMSSRSFDATSATHADSPRENRPICRGFLWTMQHDPRSQISPSALQLKKWGPMNPERQMFKGMRRPFDGYRCARCGGVKQPHEFTRDKSKPTGHGSYCRECDRIRTNEYYHRNRERILAKAAAKRGPAPARFCSECGRELERRQRVTCGSSKCREARFRRLQPESYAKREVRKIERRRERRRQPAVADA
jgi:hypothetical protein